MYIKDAFLRTCKSPLPLMLSVKFPNFSKQPFYEIPGVRFFCIVSFIKKVIISY